MSSLKATDEAKAEIETEFKDVLRTLQTFFRPGEVVEIRVLGIPGQGRPYTAAGYFDDFEMAAKWATKMDLEKKPSGIYFAMNPCDPALMARSPNKLTRYPKATTSDADITRRRWLLIDVDPCRPAGISSNKDELEAARMTAVRVREFLADKHYWAEPVQAMSGNGHHLLYLVDLPNDDDSKDLIRTILAVLDRQFGELHDASRPSVSIDKTVFNAARITKLYGTWARKGHSTPDQPHRRSEITHVPDFLT